MLGQRTLRSKPLSLRTASWSRTIQIFLLHHHFPLSKFLLSTTTNYPPFPFIIIFEIYLHTINLPWELLCTIQIPDKWLHILLIQIILCLLSNPLTCHQLKWKTLIHWPWHQIPIPLNPHSPSLCHLSHKNRNLRMKFNLAMLLNNQHQKVGEHPHWTQIFHQQWIHLQKRICALP